MSSTIREDHKGFARIKTHQTDPANHNFIALSILNKWLEEVALPEAKGVLPRLRMRRPAIQGTLSNADLALHRRRRRNRKRYADRSRARTG